MLAHVVGKRALERILARHANDEDRLDRRASLLREGDGGRDHLLADVAELHRHQHLLEVGARGQRRDRIDVVEHPDLATPANDDVDHEPEQQPRRARVASAGMRDQRQHPDDERQRRADQGGDRHEDAADPHLGLRPERPLEVGLRAPEPDHRELRGGEGEQHAERIGAREEGRVVLAEDPRHDHDRDRHRPGREQRLARDERAPLETAELAGQHPVLGHRPPEPGAPRDRRRRSREQDQRAGQPDDDAQHVDDHGRAGARRTRSRCRRSAPGASRRRGRSSRPRPGRRRGRRRRSARS